MLQGYELPWQGGAVQFIKIESSCEAALGHRMFQSFWTSVFCNLGFFWILPLRESVFGQGEWRCGPGEGVWVCEAPRTWAALAGELRLEALVLKGYFPLKTHTFPPWQDNAVPLAGPVAGSISSASLTCDQAARMLPFWFPGLRKTWF